MSSSNRLNKILSQLPHDIKRNKSLNSQPVGSDFGSSLDLTATPRSNSQVHTGNRTVVFYSRYMEKVARALVRKNPELYALGNVKWASFPDGFPNLFVDQAQDLRRSSAVFLASFHDPSCIFEQLAVIYAIPSFGVKKFKVIIPWFPQATASNLTFGGIAPAKALARMLSTTPFQSQGPVKMCIFDIHALDRVHVRVYTWIPILLERLRSLPPQELHKIAVCFPDDQALKRYKQYFKPWDIIECQAVQEEGKDEVRIKDGSPLGKRVIIVNDKPIDNGHLMRCIQAVKDAGASTISAYTSQTVFPGGWECFLTAGLDKFYVMETNPGLVELLRGRKPFEVLGISRGIHSVLRGRGT